MHNSFSMPVAHQHDYGNHQMMNNGGMPPPLQKMVSQDPMTQLQNLISGELGFNF